MKNCLIFPIISLFLLESCSNRFILRKTYMIGEENISSRVNEYNIKSKTITIKTINSTKVKSFILKQKDYKFFYETLKNVGVSNNFCWTSIENYPKYSYKYEIIFNEKRIMSNCTAKPVKYEIYDSFNKIIDSINKINKQSLL